MPHSQLVPQAQNHTDGDQHIAGPHHPASAHHVDEGADAESNRPREEKIKRGKSAGRRGGKDKKKNNELPIQYSGTEIPDAATHASSIIVINVHKNGDDINPPIKVTLKRYDLWNMTRAKDAIGDKIQAAGGFVKSLRTTAGEPVKHIADLVYGEYYVALGPHEKFNRCTYAPQGRKLFFVPTKVKNPYSKESEREEKERDRDRQLPKQVRLKKKVTECDDEGVCRQVPVSDSAHTTRSGMTNRSVRADAMSTQDATSDWNLSQRGESVHSERGDDRDHGSEHGVRSKSAMSDRNKSASPQRDELVHVHAHAHDDAGDGDGSAAIGVKQALEYSQWEHEHFRGMKDALTATMAAQEQARQEAAAMRLPSPIDLSAEAPHKKKKKMGCC